MSGSPVLQVVEAGVATVTLNRPERRNAISTEMLTRLEEVMAGLDADPQVRAIVLTGAGTAFCAGRDLSELGHVDVTGPERDRPWRPTSTPVIAAVNGPAVTGGLEVALNCDWIIASDRAVFADSHARVGIVSGWGLTVRLAALVGTARAMEMSLTCDFVSAEQAERWGLANRVVAHDELMAEALRTARSVAANHERPVRRIREIYYGIVGLPEAAARAVEALACRVNADEFTALSPEQVADVMARNRDGQDR